MIQSCIPVAGLALLIRGGPTLILWPESKNDEYHLTPIATGVIVEERDLSEICVQLVFFSLSIFWVPKLYGIFYQLVCVNFDYGRRFKKYD